MFIAVITAVNVLFNVVFSTDFSNVSVKFSITQIVAVIVADHCRMRASFLPPNYKQIKKNISIMNFIRNVNNDSYSYIDAKYSAI